MLCFHILNTTKGGINFMDILVDKKENQQYLSPKRHLCDTCAHPNVLQNFSFSSLLQHSEQLNTDD